MPICTYCKKEFTPSKYANKKAEYCSSKCCSRAGYERRLKENPYVPKERPELGIIISCEYCGKDFMQNPRYKKGIQKYCSKDCQGKYWKEKNPDKVKMAEKNYIENHPEKVRLSRRNGQLMSKYGITIEQYNIMKDNQKGCCAICGEEKDETLAVDHNHETGEVRGLLCGHCNRVVGFAKDNVDILNEIIKYLDKYKNI